MCAAVEEVDVIELFGPRHAEVFWENQKQFNKKYSDDPLSPLSCINSVSMHTVEHMGSQECYHGLAGTEDDMHSRVRLYQAAHLAGLQLERRVLAYQYRPATNHLNQSARDNPRRATQTRKGGEIVVQARPETYCPGGHWQEKQHKSLTSKLFCIIPGPNHPRSPPFFADEQSLSVEAVLANSRVSSSGESDCRRFMCDWITSRAASTGRVILSCEANVY
jgi:hypothetical protein